MKILIELNHPAHYHLFINAANLFKKNGNDVTFIVKQKDVLLSLVKSKQSIFNIINRRNSEKKRGLLNNILWMLESDYKVFKYSRKFKPEIMLGSGFSISHVGKILNIPSLVWQEDDAEVIPYLSKISYPFARNILCPAVCSAGKWKEKKISYNGYHELAYLHPEYFCPDQSRIEKFINLDEKFFILRFSKLSAYHDKGKTGITPSLASKIIGILKPKGNVYISSERELEPEFEQYRIRVDPGDVHQMLYFADLYIGDSQTMSAEAAVLGTPSIRFNDFVGKLGYLEELEHNYGLTNGIKTSEPGKLLQKIEEFLNTPGLKQEFQQRREKMLSEKIDVTAFMVWFVENYPGSVKIMKQNPGYQERFRS